jgi:hypothetical protein
MTSLSRFCSADFFDVTKKKDSRNALAMSDFDCAALSDLMMRLLERLWDVCADYERL